MTDSLCSQAALQPELENAVESDNRIRIVLYTQQPFVAQGLAAVLHSHADLELAACLDSLMGPVREGGAVCGMDRAAEGWD